MMPTIAIYRNNELIWSKEFEKELKYYDLGPDCPRCEKGDIVAFSIVGEGYKTNFDISWVATPEAIKDGKLKVPSFTSAGGKQNADNGDLPKQ